MQISKQEWAAAPAAPRRANLIKDIIAARSCAAIERGEVIEHRDAAGTLCLRFDLHLLDESWRNLALDRLCAHAGVAKLIFRYQKAWTAAARSNGRDAADLLERLLAHRAVTRVPLTQHVYRDPTPPADANPMLRASWKLWERTRGLISDGAAGLARLLPFMQISVPNQHGERPRFVHIGGRTTCAVLWRDWSAREGLASCSIPDEKLEVLVSQAYSRVLETGDPQFDDIIAPIARADGEYAWLPYRRLILPCRLANDRPAFNCATHFLSGPEAAIPTVAP